MATLAYAPAVPARTPVSVVVSVAIPVFLGAYLLFQVQPLIARRILPWFGGGASVWTACMLFFQLMLLAGYAYAHWAARRLKVHCFVVALSLLALPVIPAESWKPGPADEPVSRILLLLGATVGLPYFVLSSTSPIMQAVFARRSGGQSPYRLFALSNAGSLLGLLAYPLMVEPVLGLGEQAVWWSVGYAMYAGAVVWAVVDGRRSYECPNESGHGGEESPRHVHASWIFLPAAASVVLLAATAYITQNVPPTPFLWILPLTAYLVSFIVAFDAERWYRPELVRRLSWLALGAMALPLSSTKVVYNVPLVAGIVTFGVFIIALYCHGETVRRKPTPQHLTRFYLMIAAGGAVGGVLVGAVSPLALSDQVEYLAALAVATAALLFSRAAATRRAVRLRFGFAACLIAIVTAAAFNGARGALASERNFYGSTRVLEQGERRSLGHGSVIHGIQITSSPRVATSYYAPGSGVQLAIATTRRQGQRVGVIGLGAGTLATYGREGDWYTFYEINPQVIDLAGRWFTFLRDSHAGTEVVSGDGRLALERETARDFDVLVVDAFSGDSVPAHLLTTEALALYRRHVRPEGIIAFHISNTVLDLAPVVGALARTAGMRHTIVSLAGSTRLHREASDWALLTDRGQLPNGKPARVQPGLRVWTDDYWTLLPVLR